MEPVATLGIDHLDLTVSDRARSVAFYERVLGMLGFTHVAQPEEPAYTVFASPTLAIGLREASPAQRHTPFDRHSPGLHHLSFRAASRADVDRFHAFLVAAKIVVLDPPAAYPQYGAGYYAVFFADPDGMKLEVAHFPWGYWKRVQTDGHDERPRRARPA